MRKINKKQSGRKSKIINSTFDSREKLYKKYEKEAQRIIDEDDAHCDPASNEPYVYTREAIKWAFINGCTYAERLVSKRK